MEDILVKTASKESLIPMSMGEINENSDRFKDF